MALKTSDLRNIRDLWVRGKSMRYIASQVGVSHQAVSRVVNRERESLEPRREESVNALVDQFIGSFQGMTKYQHIARGLLNSKGEKS
jgi:IS30 family transposase